MLLEVGNMKKILILLTLFVFLAQFASAAVYSFDELPDFEKGLDKNSLSGILNLKRGNI